MMEGEDDLKLVSRLKRHPKLLARMGSLLAVVEDASGDIKKAAEAEMRVIEEMRQMGHEALSSWARDQSEKASEGVRVQGDARSAGKKNCNRSPLF